MRALDVQREERCAREGRGREGRWVWASSVRRRGGRWDRADKEEEGGGEGGCGGDREGKNMVVSSAAWSEIAVVSVSTRISVKVEEVVKT